MTSRTGPSCMRIPARLPRAEREMQAQAGKIAIFGAGTATISPFYR